MSSVAALAPPILPPPTRTPAELTYPYWSMNGLANAWNSAVLVEVIEGMMK